MFARMVKTVPRFIHLRCHSEHSMLEGAIPVGKLAKLAAAQGMPAVALTDTNALFAALEFSVKAQAEGVQPIVEPKDAALAEQLTTRFDELQALLDARREGDGFVGYDELTPEQVKELSNAVNALSEPLSRLTAAVLS